VTGYPILYTCTILPHELYFRSTWSRRSLLSRFRTSLFDSTLYLLPKNKYTP